MDRYAVIGNPVAHSKSPEIHAEFARSTGEDIEYGRLLASLDGFAVAVERFRAGGGKGANVTLPFKEDAFRLATALSNRARGAQAVNTLRFDRDRIFGDNTDGAGLVRDIRHNRGVALAGKRVLLLGAGGAARGVIAPLLAEHPASLVVANRTPGTARALAVLFGRGVEANTYAELAGARFAVVVNATSASLAGNLPPLPECVFAPGALAYEMVYGMGETPVLAFARTQGAGVLADGLGMLIERRRSPFSSGA